MCRSSKRHGITCPTCQQGTLIKRPGKHGPFHACNRYPDCKTTFPDDNGQPNLNPKPRQNAKPSTEEFCKQCGNPLVRRPGKKEGSFWWDAAVFLSVKYAFLTKTVNRIEIAESFKHPPSPAMFT
ncbi:topoisomerase DNA-binding C4 zinc finger domain-containing protein [Vibrio parahaemolyticus]|uniref:topoisomerase DNA-binding C4 zinc finger domain-containing protein n=1 Tax=Vibrio parahaemolyticus TaxID=670 RepID=UPI001CC6D48E|nr:topoisomerase DNA-binding C4 zinc finger domain-containing protein [Vibrio parahaemolyticus]